MLDNPYQPPDGDATVEAPTPLRVRVFSSGNLILAGLGFGLLIFAKATRKNSFSWSMTGEVHLAGDQLENLASSNRSLMEIELYYRIFEGSLILMSAMFLLSGIAMLCRARWSVAVANVSLGLALAGCSAFIGVFFTTISSRLLGLCADLGTSPNTLVLGFFLGGLGTILLYSCAGLILLNRPVVRRFLHEL